MSKQEFELNRASVLYMFTCARALALVEFITS